MRRRDIALWRSALVAGINAVFDVLEAAARVEPSAPRVRPPARPDGEYTELDKQRADEIQRRYGVRS